MKEFYSKYAKHLGESAAYKLVKAQVCKAIDAEEKGEDPLFHLSVAHEMIENIFKEKVAGEPATYRD